MHAIVISEKLSKIEKKDVDHKKGSKSKAIGKSILQRFVVTVVSTDGVPSKRPPCVRSILRIIACVCVLVVAEGQGVANLYQ